MVSRAAFRYPLKSAISAARTLFLQPFAALIRSTFSRGNTECAPLDKETRVKRFLGILIGGVAGAAVGYAFYRFVGCRTGTCPLSGQPWTAMLMPALAGILFSAGAPAGKNCRQKYLSRYENVKEREMKI
jgi:hypothetical protein